MKKVILCLVVFVFFLLPFANAQNPTLIANDWVLNELNVNGTQTLPSNINYLSGQDVILSFTDSGTDYGFDTYVCQSEAIAGTISYPFAGTPTDQFNVLFSGQALSACCVAQVDVSTPPDPDCVAILDFSSAYFNFWSAPASTNYGYEIISMGNTITLRITKPNGDFALYSNVPLSNGDFTISSEIVLESNPVDDNLVLSGDQLNQIETVQIFDLQGKLFLESSYTKNGIIVSELNSGIYFLKITTEKAQLTLRFIKH